MLSLWLSWRYLKSNGKFLNFTSWLGILGLAIGVGALIVSMAVVSGYESTLKRNIIDVTGQIMISKKGLTQDQIDTWLPTIVDPQQVEAYTPFLYREGMVAHDKKLKGVFIEGFDESRFSQVVHLESRIKSGKIQLKKTSEHYPALIGKALADKYQLKVGDLVSVILPKKSEFQTQIMSPRIQKFQIAAILDFGRFEYNERYMIVNIEALQKLVARPNQISGVKLNLKDLQQAMPLAERLNQSQEQEIWSKGWKDQNSNLFEAVAYEKYVIFAVVLIMVIAASFNVSSTLFVNVFKRYSDISILKTLGLTQKEVIRLFSLQGLFIGFIGTLLGFLLGALACYGFLWAQEVWNLIPEETYKIDKIILDVKPLDVILIFSSTLLICFLSTLAPAFRGAKLEPVKGLRYE